MRLARELDAIEIRVLGSLMEKQLSTPEAYPLTVNALILACNQKSNREPVLALTEEDVTTALERLRELVLVWKVEGARTERWEHNLDARWELGREGKAILTLLFLRGAQTPGELRGRSDRLHAFPSLEEVERVLADMAAESEPLVFELPRRPGQKETRWGHLVGPGGQGPARTAPLPVRTEPLRTEPAPRSFAPTRPSPAEEPSALSLRVEELANEVAQLREELADLKRRLGA